MPALFVPTLPIFRPLKLLLDTSTKILKQKLTLRLSMSRATPRYLRRLKKPTFPLKIIIQILQAVVLQAKKLGKAIYVFSVDLEGGKVIHVNHVPESFRSKGFDARTWAARVTETLGGKVRTFGFCNFRIELDIVLGWRKGGRRARCWR